MKEITGRQKFCKLSLSFKFKFIYMIHKISISVSFKITTISKLFLKSIISFYLFDLIKSVFFQQYITSKSSGLEKDKQNKKQHN